MSRTIADDAKTFAETGHLYAPLLESLYNAAMKTGKPFEIVTPGYYDEPEPKPLALPKEKSRRSWKFWNREGK